MKPRKTVLRMGFHEHRLLVVDAASAATTPFTLALEVPSPSEVSAAVFLEEMDSKRGVALEASILAITGKFLAQRVRWNEGPWERGPNRTIVRYIDVG